MDQPAEEHHSDSDSDDSDDSAPLSNQKSNTASNGAVDGPQQDSAPAGKRKRRAVDYTESLWSEEEEESEQEPPWEEMGKKKLGRPKKKAKAVLHSGPSGPMGGFGASESSSSSNAGSDHGGSKDEAWGSDLELESSCEEGSDEEAAQDAPGGAHGKPAEEHKEEDGPFDFVQKAKPAEATQARFLRPPRATLLNIPRKPYTAMEAFVRCFPEYLMLHIVKESNRFGDVLAEEKHKKQKEGGTHFFKEFSLKELKVLFGLLIAMAIAPRSSVPEYWRKGQCGAITEPNFGRFMTR